MVDNLYIVLTNKNGLKIMAKTLDDIPQSIAEKIQNGEWTIKVKNIKQEKEIENK